MMLSASSMLLTWSALPTERLDGVFTRLRTLMANRGDVLQGGGATSPGASSSEVLIGMIAVGKVRKAVLKELGFYPALLSECERTLREGTSGPNLRAIELFSLAYDLQVPMAGHVVGLMSPYRVVEATSDADHRGIELLMDKVIASMSELGYPATQRATGPLFLMWYYMYVESLCEMLTYSAE
jgi:hypothetical protein